jgi:hypothetical protein
VHTAHIHHNKLRKTGGNYYQELQNLPVYSIGKFLKEEKHVGERKQRLS